LGFLSFLLFSLERLNELSFFLKERGYIGQDNCTAATSLIVGFTVIETNGKKHILAALDL
jgi:hypothetical protein